MNEFTNGEDTTNNNPVISPEPDNIAVDNIGGTQIPSPPIEDNVKINPTPESESVKSFPDTKIDDGLKSDRKKKVLKILSLIIIAILFISNGALTYFTFSKDKQNKKLQSTINSQNEELVKRQATIDEQLAQIAADAAAVLVPAAATTPATSTTKKSTTTSVQEEVVTPPAPPSD